MSKTNEFQSEMASGPVVERGVAIQIHKSARDHIRWALLKRISEGVYLPGERLKEMALAQEFEVSQAPVREVFRELETLGLLVSEHYRGTRVREISSQEIYDAYQLRGYLEEIAAQLILLLAVVRALEQHDAIAPRCANPIQLAAVVVHPREHPVHHAMLGEISAPHPDLVPLRTQPQVHVPEIATMSDTEKAHAST